MQAQEYANAKWAIGLRCAGATDATVEQAIADGSVVRTWLLRGTLHFAAAQDVRWMLALLGPAPHRQTAHAATRSWDWTLQPWRAAWTPSPARWQTTGN